MAEWTIQNWSSCYSWRKCITRDTCSWQPGACRSRSLSTRTSRRTATRVSWAAGASRTAAAGASWTTKSGHSARSPPAPSGDTPRPSSSCTWPAEPAIKLLSRITRLLLHFQVPCAEEMSCLIIRPLQPVFSFFKYR